jgi:hypothetical protein
LHRCSLVMISASGWFYQDANIKVTAVENSHYQFHSGPSAGIDTHVTIAHLLDLGWPRAPAGASRSGRHSAARRAQEAKRIFTGVVVIGNEPPDSALNPHHLVNFLCRK